MCQMPLLRSLGEFSALIYKHFAPLALATTTHRRLVIFKGSGEQARR
jgi:hypothetical protein